MLADTRPNRVRRARAGVDSGRCNAEITDRKHLRSVRTGAALRGAISSYDPDQRRRATMVLQLIAQDDILLAAWADEQRGTDER